MNDLNQRQQRPKAVPLSTGCRTDKVRRLVDNREASRPNLKTSIAPLCSVTTFKASITLMIAAERILYASPISGMVRPKAKRRLGENKEIEKIIPAKDEF